MHNYVQIRPTVMNTQDKSRVQNLASSDIKHYGGKKTACGLDFSRLPCLIYQSALVPTRAPSLRVGSVSVLV